MNSLNIPLPGGGFFEDSLALWILLGFLGGSLRIVWGLFEDCLEIACGLPGDCFGIVSGYEALGIL